VGHSILFPFFLLSSWCWMRKDKVEDEKGDVVLVGAGTIEWQAVGLPLVTDVKLSGDSRSHSTKESFAALACY
jgi:hypothetical protein